MTAAALAVTLSTPLAATAAAPEDGPHMRNDACDPSDTPTVQVGGERVICQGWFSTILTERDDGELDVDGVRVTLEFLDRFEDGTLPTRVTVRWFRDGCREGWRLDTTLAEGPGLFLDRRCGEDPALTHPLTIDQASIAGDRLTVTVLRDDVEAVGSGLRLGDVLGAPVGWSAVLVRAAHDLAAEATVESSTAGPRRDFVVGSE